MKDKNFSIVNSFNAAIEGFFHVMKTQQNMRIHFIIGTFVLLLGIYLNFTRIEIMILCLTIGFVLVAEMFNTAVEFLLDKMITTRDERVKIIKDISAGTVLLAAIIAMIVSYFLFLRHKAFADINYGLIKLKQSDWHITFLSLIVVIAFVILLKAILHKGTPLRGGMPSGHAAVSFSIATIIILISPIPLISVLALILALLVSQSRIRKGLHTLWEVFAGAILGTIVTVLIYQLFALTGHA